MMLLLSVDLLDAQWIGCPNNNSTTNIYGCACSPQSLLDESLHLYKGGPSYTINQFLISVCNASGQTGPVSTFATSYNQSLNAGGQAVWSGGCTISGKTYGTDCIITPTLQGAFTLDWDAFSISAANPTCYSYFNSSNFDEYLYWTSTGANSTGAFDLKITDFIFNSGSFVQVCKTNTFQLTSDLNMPNGWVTHTMTTTSNASNALKYTAGVGYRFEAQLVPAGQYVVSCVGTFDNGPKTIQITIEVVDNALTQTPIDLCSNAPLFDLSTLYPYTGNFSGPGTTVNNSTKTFNPSVASIGNNTINFSYTEPNSGCALVHNFIINVKSSPSVAVPNDFEVCEDFGNINLLTLVAPQGGTFSGTGVSGNNYIPQFAGTGVHTVTYSLTNAQGCTDSESWNITVEPAVVVTVPQNQFLCLDGGIQNYATMVSPTGGTFSGAGITPAGLFNPQTLGPGSTNITYSFTNSFGCSKSGTFQVTVYPSVDVTVPSVLNFCTINGAYNLLNAPNLFPLGSGGVFSGTGISGNNFIPSFAGVGTFPITYTFTNQQGCSDAGVIQVTVNQTPTISVPSDFTVCSDQAPIDLTTLVSPVSNQFTGTGVSNASFIPSIAGPGTFPITYNYTSLNGCSASDSWNITVVDALNNTISIGPDRTVCLTTAPINLNETNSFPGGIYTGTAVVDSIFYPSIAGAGSFLIEYAITSNSCVLESSRTITVLNVPNEPTITGNLDYCLGSNTQLSVSNLQQNIQYDWSENGAVIHTGNSLNNFVVQGNTTLTVVGRNVIGCLSTEKDIDLVTLVPSGVIEASQMTINSGQIVNFSIDNADNVSAYNWNLGNGQSSTNASPNIYYYAETNDNYYNVSCTLISSIGCETEVDLVGQIHVIAPIDTGTNIKDIDGLTNLSIYPNPTNDYLVIQFDFDRELHLIVTDISGKLLMEDLLSSGYSLSVSDFTPGIYFITLHEPISNQFIINKIVKY